MPSPTPPPTEVCPWKNHHKESEQQAKCADGTFSWSCMKGGHGQRIKCPPSLPQMCDNLGCGGGKDYCCEKNCDGKGGPRPCPSPHPTPHQGNAHGKVLITEVCRRPNVLTVTSLGTAAREGMASASSVPYHSPTCVRSWDVVRMDKITAVRKTVPAKGGSGVAVCGGSWPLKCLRSNFDAQHLLMWLLAERGALRQAVLTGNHL